MPNLEYFLVCESISTDQETNRVSLFNVLEDLQVLAQGHAGILLSQLIAVSCWNHEPDDEGKDFQQIVRIHSPGSTEPKDFPVNFQMERPRQRISVRFQGMPKLQPGPLKFELLLNGEHVAWHTVNVTEPVTPTADSQVSNSQQVT